LSPDNLPYLYTIYSSYKSQVHTPIYVLKQANPDLLIIHYPGYYHSDHINVSKLVFEASYLSNLKL
jgi:hypothetical protein